ncbi:MAG: DUF2061 domain-containing protein [Bacteroidota bacterium]|nr:DUF2061 domain-containing protein [Bacteroidota bacterium]
MEHKYRNIIKAVSWRLTGSIDTFIVSFVITGKPVLALSISGVEVFTKIGLFYFHERAWNRIRFGRMEVTEPDYQI